MMNYFNYDTKNAQLGKELNGIAKIIQHLLTAEKWLMLQNLPRKEQRLSKRHSSVSIGIFQYYSK